MSKFNYYNDEENKILDKIFSEYPFDSETVKSGRLLIKFYSK